MINLIVRLAKLFRRNWDREGDDKFAAIMGLLLFIIFIAAIGFGGFGLVLLCIEQPIAMIFILGIPIILYSLIKFTLWLGRPTAEEIVAETRRAQRRGYTYNPPPRPRHPVDRSDVM